MSKPVKDLRNMTFEEYENLPTLGLDDAFEFTCKACGKCCKYNRNDLLLTSYDVYRIAKYFGRTTEQIITRYCEIYIGDTSNLPIARIIPQPPHGSCPLMLKNGKCAVHQSKPVVCRVYPLARLFKADGGGSRYYFNGASCSHEPKPITVREWLADVASDEAEEAGTLWRDVLTTLLPMVQPDKIKLKETREQAFQLLIGGLYMAYDIEQPFTPQLQRNFEMIKTVLSDAII